MYDQSVAKEVTDSQKGTNDNNKYSEEKVENAKNNLILNMYDAFKVYNTMKV
jgi:hypothetical protein